MKSSIFYPLICLGFVLILTTNSLAQNQSENSHVLRYELKKHTPFPAIEKVVLTNANDLKDFDAYFKSAWIKEYLSIEIAAIVNGKNQKAVSEQSLFSTAQKELLQSADLGTPINIHISYLPNNTLEDNSPKDLSFAIMVYPEHVAEFKNGETTFNAYLTDHALISMQEQTFLDTDLTAIKFQINENGGISDAQILSSAYQSSSHENADKLLLEAVKNMPNWNPSSYSNGSSAKQEFILSVGNLESCVRNTLVEN